jgi:hypothetical protein
MGWLPVRRKHKGDEHPESQTVPTAGKPGDPGGTGVMGDPSKGVVKAGGSSANTTHLVGPAPTGGGTFPFGGRIVIGAARPALDPTKCKTCGHEVSVVMVAGCWDYQHVHAWLACHQCQMETLWQIRHGENETYVACGHKIGDLIYSYLPDDPQYHALGGKMFTVNGTLADDHP